MDRGAWPAIVHEISESETTERLTLTHAHTHTHTHTHIHTSWRILQPLCCPRSETVHKASPDLAPMIWLPYENCK